MPLILQGIDDHAGFDDHMAGQIPQIDGVLLKGSFPLLFLLSFLIPYYLLLGTEVANLPVPFMTARKALFSSRHKTTGGVRLNQQHTQIILASMDLFSSRQQNVKIEGLL